MHILRHACPAILVACLALSTAVPASAQVSTYSTTPGSNTSLTGVNVSEGMAPGLLNDALRRLMADLAGYYGTAGTKFAVGGGTITVDTSGNLRTPDGTVVTPGLGFTLETNSGLRRVSAGLLSVVTQGFDRATFGPIGVTANANQAGFRANHGFSLSDFSEIAFGIDGVGRAAIRSFRAANTGGGDEGDLRFFVSPGTAGGTGANLFQAAMIDANGNLLVGTSNPGLQTCASAPLRGLIARIARTRTDGATCWPARSTTSGISDRSCAPRPILPIGRNAHHMVTVRHGGATWPE